jgi:polar amino acid transport system substrate-binding protein
MSTTRFAGFRLVLAGLLTALMAACGQAPDEAPGTTTLERARAAGVIRLGFANEAPFAFLDQTSGELTGEAPAIARALLARLGVPRVEGVLTEWGALIPGLKAGRFDLIAAGMYITPRRCREVAFSNPTYAIGEALVVPAGNPLGLHGYQDLARLGTVRVGVVTGTVELGYARAAGVPDGRIVLLPDNPAGLAALSAGRIEAFAATALTVADLLGKAGPAAGLERADPFRQPLVDGRPVRGYGAFAMRQEDQALREALNQELAQFIGSDAHRQLVAPFGFSAAELPGAVTAAELCRGDD